MAELGHCRMGAASGRSLSAIGFSMIPARDAARFTFRARGLVIDTASQAFGVDLPRRAFCTAATDARAALWMGPDEWLLIGPQSDKVLIEEQLTRALAGTAYSLVDVSHRDVAVELSGDRAAAVLNSGCPLDLHPSVFAVGMCTRTLMAKAQIVLWRTEPLLFHVQTLRSFADYIWQLLEQAARDVDA
jgi:sarcosine oxidase, subunit gamma